MPGEQAGAAPAKWALWVNVATVLFLAAIVIVRLVGLRTEPWEDELWSLQLAQRARTIGQILGDEFFHIDNNHWLNTLWMHLLDEQAAFWPYRLLALVSGLGMLVPVWLIVRRWDGLAARLAVVMLGLSLMFVEYGTEARGYGPAAALAMLAAWASVNFVQGHRPAAMAWVTGLSCVLGLLSHATFLFALIGIAIYAAVGLYRQGRTPGQLVTDLAKLLAGPMVFAAWLYVTAIAPMRFGGGPRVSIDSMLAGLFFFTTGVPIGSGWAGLLLAALASAYGVVVLARQKRDEWVLLLTAGWIGPAAILLIRQPQLLYGRYLFVALPFVLLLSATGLADLLRRRWPVRAVGAALVAAFLIGSGYQLWRFSLDGRGQFRTMLSYLAQNTAGTDVMLAAENKFRFALGYQYYATRLPRLEKRFGYVPPESPVPPEWFVADAGVDDPLHPALTIYRWPDNYVFVTKFDYYGVSGAQWRVYRRQGSQP